MNLEKVSRISSRSLKQASNIQRIISFNTIKAIHFFPYLAPRFHHKLR